MSTKKYCPRDNDYCTITSHHCWNDKSNNVHQSYARTMSEQSTPVLKIPLWSAMDARNKNILLNTRKMIYQPRIIRWMLAILSTITLMKYSGRKKHNMLGQLLNKNHLLKFILFTILINTHNVLVECAVGGKSAMVKHRDHETINELCKNFTQGNPERMEFASPLYGHGHEYPKDLTCFRTITADHGYFVRIDFRDIFNVEPASNEGNCDYDYLEIRDGDQGYSPLIGVYWIILAYQ